MLPLPTESQTHLIHHCVLPSSLSQGTPGAQRWLPSPPPNRTQNMPPRSSSSSPLEASPSSSAAFFRPPTLRLLLVALLLFATLSPVVAFRQRLPRMPVLPATTKAASSRIINTSPLAGHNSIGGGDGPTPLLKDPVSMYESAVELGIHKAEEPAPIIFLLGIQAGLQVGIGAAMAVATMAGLPGISASDPSLGKLIYGFCGLPCGLLMTATTGTMLFTGNTALVSVALMEKKIKLRQLLKSWIWSYTGNLLGAAMLAALCTYAGVFKSVAASMVSVAAYKTTMPFGVALARGVLCNWLVTTAVWISQATHDLVSKATAIILIITIFASLGFEHSVANMFIGPFGALNGGPRFLTFFLKNLVPVTLGNIIAGVMLVAFSNFITYGSGSKRWRVAKQAHRKGFDKTSSEH